MERINLQTKAKALNGKAEKYWFENENIGLKKTLFHVIHIPLSPFDSGLEYESQPVETIIVMDWLKLGLKDPDDLDALQIFGADYEDVETSIYVGNAHNPCDILKLKINRKEGDLYQIDCELLVDFEYEMVAAKEHFSFQTTFEYFPNVTNEQNSKV